MDAEANSTGLASPTTAQDIGGLTTVLHLRPAGGMGPSLPRCCTSGLTSTASNSTSIYKHKGHEEKHTRNFRTLHWRSVYAVLKASRAAVKAPSGPLRG